MFDFLQKVAILDFTHNANYFLARPLYVVRTGSIKNHARHKNHKKLYQFIV